MLLIMLCIIVFGWYIPEMNHIYCNKNSIRNHKSISHLNQIFWFLFFQLFLPNCYAENITGLTFTLTSTTLPNKDKQQSHAYSNTSQTIWLFGGAYTGYVSVSSYDIPTATVKTYSNSLQQFPIYARFPIVNDIMYWNPTGSSYIARFFTTTGSFDYNYMLHPQSYSNFRLTQRDNDILFALGGNDTTQFNLLNLTTFIWYVGQPFTIVSMWNQPLVGATRMYKLSGSLIDYIDVTGSINDIIEREWSSVTVDLANRDTNGVVVYNKLFKREEIWCFGGYTSWALSGAKIINTETFDITNANTGFTLTDMVDVYVEYEDTVYLLSGFSDNFGGPLDRVYKVTYYIATPSPTLAPTTFFEENQMNGSIIVISAIMVGIMLCTCCLCCGNKKMYWSLCWIYFVCISFIACFASLIDPGVIKWPGSALNVIEWASFIIFGTNCFQILYVILLLKFTTCCCKSCTDSKYFKCKTYENHIFIDENVRYQWIILTMLCLLGSIIPTAFILKSKTFAWLNRISITSIIIWQTLCGDIIIWISYIILQATICISISAATTGPVSFAFFVIICIITFVMIVYHLLFFIVPDVVNRCSEHDLIDSKLKMEIQFGHNKDLNIFTSKRKDYEYKLFRVINKYVPNTVFAARRNIYGSEAQNSYIMDIINMCCNIDDKYDILTVLMSIRICIDRDKKKNYNYDERREILKMQLNFQKMLGSSEFAQDIAVFCKRSKEKELPLIRIGGMIQDLSNNAIRSFEINRNEQIKRIKSETIDKLKPLHKCSNDDIKNIICYWILNDEKYTTFGEQIIKIMIDDVSINGIATQDILTGQKNLNYLTNLFKDYINDKMMVKIANILSTETFTENQIKFDELIRIIYKYPIDQIQKKLQIDGKWVVKNLQSENFMHKLFHITSMNADDIQQIYAYIKRYNVPKNKAFVSKITQVIEKKLSHHINSDNIKLIMNDDTLSINFAVLALKLKNNIKLNDNMEQLSNLIHYIDECCCDNNNGQDILSQLYAVFANAFSELCLNEWWCFKCNYHNRICKIGNKFLNYTDRQMKNCLVCGLNKIKSIHYSLRNVSLYHDFAQESNQYVDVKYEIDCIDVDDINQCLSWKNVLGIIQSSNTCAKYKEILSNVSNDDAYTYIIRTSIDNLNDELPSDKIFLKSIFQQNQNPLTDAIGLSVTSQDCKYIPSTVMNHKIDGNWLCALSEQDLAAFIRTAHKTISYATIHCLYRLILNQCDEYVTQTRGDCSELQKCWNHILQTHTDGDCKQSIYICQNVNDFDACNDCKEKIKEYKCNDKCTFMQRKRTRIRNRHRRNTFNYADVDDGKMQFDNDHILWQIGNDEVYQSLFDSIHCTIFHQKIYQNKTSRRDTNIGEYFMYNGEDEYNDDYYNRYSSDIGLYGFGIYHSHELLKPLKQNSCFKAEFLNYGYSFCTEETWERCLREAFNKFRSSNHYTSQQFNDDYNIHRGDKLSVHHLLAIMFYSNFSDLCTEFRSTFRKTEHDINEESIRKRHSKFYYLSRYIYECIEYYGNIMNNSQYVFHGLNKPFLFKQFATTFHAPTSTTPDKIIASNFSKDYGIILKLRKKNTDIHDSIAKFSKNQPRYLDISWISCFGNERELLFYGDTIALEICDIIHREIPKNTLKQLNLLQKIITNKDIDWDQQNETRINSLCKKIEEAENMNVKLLTGKYNNGSDPMDKLLDTLKSHTEAHIDCISFMNFLKIEEYDLDSILYDIDDNANNYKNSNLFFTLKQNAKLIILIEEHLNESNTAAVANLRSQLVESMTCQQFIQFSLNVLKKIVNESLNLNLSANEKSDLLNGFERFCSFTNISGKHFCKIPVKMFTNWMTKQYKIDTTTLLEIYNAIIEELNNYDTKISKMIEQIEKELTEQFPVPYYRKLFHYFCVSKTAFVAIKRLFEIQQKQKRLFDTLFVDSQSEQKYDEEDGKYEYDKESNIENNISLTKLTNMFSNVEHIIFTDLQYQQMIKYCSMFCESVICYYRNKEMNKNKKLKLIQFKSIDMNNSKYSSMLKRVVKKYQLNEVKINISYKFELEMNHLLTFQIHE